MIYGKTAFINPLENWRPVGWFNLDLAVYIIYAVILAGLILILNNAFKRKRRQQPLHPGMLVKAAGIVLVVGFLAGTFFLWVFNAAGRSVTVELDSPAIVLEESGHHLSINKIRMRIPNGHSNGISTSVSHFELIAVDINTGETRWHRKSYWQEYAIGHTSQGILTVDSKKKKLQFIDPQTGKTALTEKELVAQIPALKGNLSYSFTDYRLTSAGELYLYALDGQYYKVDLAANTATAKPEYEKLVKGGSFRSPDVYGISEEEAWNIQSQLPKLYPELLEMKLLNIDPGDATALVGYHEKRNEKTWSISRISLREHNLMWKARVDAPETGTAGEAYAGWRSGNKTLIFTNGKQFSIDWETGNIAYEYVYRWNKAVKH